MDTTIGSLLHKLYGFQVGRVPAHLGLSHTCFQPLTIPHHYHITNRHTSAGKYLRRRTTPGICCCQPGQPNRRLLKPSIAFVPDFTSHPMTNTFWLNQNDRNKPAEGSKPARANQKHQLCHGKPISGLFDGVVSCVGLWATLRKHWQLRESCERNAAREAICELCLLHKDYFPRQLHTSCFAEEIPLFSRVHCTEIQFSRVHIFISRVNCI